MSQTEATTAVVAEERMEEIRSFARRIRTATQRSYTTKETIQVAVERCRREVSLKNYARELVSSPTSTMHGSGSLWRLGRINNLGVCPRNNILNDMRH